MDKRYLEFNWEQLLEEDAFISWITRNENDNQWKHLIEQHPQFEKEVVKAKQIHALLKDKHENMNDSSVQRLWKEIETYYQQNKQKAGVLRLYKPLAWAATVLLVLSIGAFALFNWQRIIPGDYQFLSQKNEKEAHILLANGERILLNQNNSKIIFYESGDEILVNDSLISLKNYNFKASQNFNELVTPFGYTSELKLADGTSIWLNAGSRLAFQSIYSKKNRKVYLEGEAFFDVAHNDNQPFIADAGRIDVLVSGTKFNLSAYPEEERIEAVLVEGSISIQMVGAFKLFSGEMLVAPNQRVVFEKEDKDFYVFEENDLNIYTAWINGLLIYRQESLASVLRKVERYYNVKIELPKDYHSDDKISGKLDLQNSIETVMRILADASGFKYHIESDKIVIEKQEKKLNTNLEKSRQAWPPDSL
jgi:transmembrane sensor